MRAVFFGIAIGFGLVAHAFADRHRESQCFRQNLSEFRLTALDSGSAEFEIESVQGGSHFCTLVGQAAPTEDGYRYTEVIEGLGECQLSMVFDVFGRVSFQDPDWICKRYYCGARAAFEHIEFGPLDRIACD